MKLRAVIVDDGPDRGDRGRARAARYTWRETARAHASGYREVLS